MGSPKLLIKLPSRERPDTLLHVAGLYANLCADPDNTRILITADQDDLTFSESLIDRLRDLVVPVSIIRGQRHSKIEAVNRDLPGLWPWDVLLAASDDMWPVVHGYDTIIKNELVRHFPDTNGCMWFYDGRQTRLCTLSIMGRTAFETDGYVYQPGYWSYWCDDEWTEKWSARGKLVRDPRCLIIDEHPQWRGKAPDDRLYDHNRTHKKADHQYYNLRKAAGFP